MSEPSITALRPSLRKRETQMSVQPFDDGIPLPWQAPAGVGPRRVRSFAAVAATSGERPCTLSGQHVEIDVALSKSDRYRLPLRFEALRPMHRAASNDPLACERQRRPKKNRTVSRAFGQVLRAIRDQRDVTQETLAELAELDTTYISLLERGLREPTLSILLRLGAALHIAGTKLLGYTQWQLRRGFICGGAAQDRAGLPSTRRHRTVKHRKAAQRRSFRKFQLSGRAA
jgi:transcriptional regulator with XRE-family HTH domain